MNKCMQTLIMVKTLVRISNEIGMFGLKSRRLHS